MSETETAVDWLQARVDAGHYITGARLVEIIRGQGVPVTPDEGRTLACMFVTAVSDPQLVQAFHDEVMR